MKQGIIFDLDGVLTDTVEYHYRSWQRLADELGLTFTREHNERLRGLSRPDALRLFLAGRTVDGYDQRELLELKNRYFLEGIETLGPQDLAPGVLDLLDAARDNGVLLGLASSSRNARLVCSRLGILERFAAFADGCSGLRSKPEPDLFLWVAGRLGLSPARCTVVEDAEAGVAAALAGGFRVVGVGAPELVAGAHLVVPALAQLRLEQLLNPMPSAALGSPTDESGGAAA